MAFSLVVTGDSILTRRVSDVADRRFLAIADVLRRATVTTTHFETLIHDYQGPEVYPSAEAGWTWMRSPRSVVDELHWLEVDMVSLASNHALDYGVGGLRSTWAALEAGGITHAGTGSDLDSARAPAFVWRAGREVAMVSLTTSAPRAARAGRAFAGVPGRPGVNPLGFHYRTDAATLYQVRSLAATLGMWVEQIAEGRWLVHPPGLHNSGTVYAVDEQVTGADMVADADDEAGNLAAVADAARRADVTVVHVHNHEWDPVRGLSTPPSFVTSFAHRCVEAGASVVVVEGSHAPMRGVELYGDAVIVYDPGELFMQSSEVTRLPHDFYRRHAHHLGGPIHDASMADVLAARRVRGSTVENPPGGYRSGAAEGGVVVEIEFTDAGVLDQVRLHPFDRERIDGEIGVLPRFATAANAAAILTYLDELSAPLGARVSHVDGIGVLARTGGQEQ